MASVKRALAFAGATHEADSEVGVPYLQERVSLLARMFFTMGCFFFVASNLHRSTFLPGFTFFLEPSNLIHASVLVLQFLAWRISKLPKLGLKALSVLDGGIVLGTLTATAMQAPIVRMIPGYSVDMLMVMLANVALMVRAVIVPSTPRKTFVISLLGVIPGFTVAGWLGSVNHRIALSLSFVGIWCVAIVAITTFASTVIFGLRQKAAQAKKLGQYVLEKKIGQGGMGEVYLARHTLLRRPTAVKLVPPDRAGADTIARFEREVRETSLLSHPNTVAIYDYGRTHDGTFYYAMEYLEGADLQRTVERQGTFPASRVVHVLAQIAGALAEAHGRGLVHRDIKPANVILCERGGIKDTAKVVDFGLVKHITKKQPGDVKQTDVNALIGTPAYMSPEAIRSLDEIDARSDLYGVGAVGYFLLTGKHVFDADSVMDMYAAHLHEKPILPSARARRPVSPDLEFLVMKCLAKDPEERFQSAAELRDALLACDIPEWTPENADDKAAEFPSVAPDPDADPTALTALVRTSAAPRHALGARG